MLKKPNGSSTAPCAGEPDGEESSRGVCLGTGTQGKMSKHSFQGSFGWGVLGGKQPKQMPA